MRVFTLRISEPEAEEVETIARIEGVAVSQIIREAIQVEIAARRRDPAFQERIRAQIKRDEELLKRLAR